MGTVDYLADGVLMVPDQRTVGRLACGHRVCQFTSTKQASEAPLTSGTFSKWQQ